MLYIIGNVIERCSLNCYSMQDEAERFGVNWKGLVCHEDYDEIVSHL